ncbi:MAG TPA: M3 family metallopeptidase [Bryobacteraceae bacterium]|jgi:oligopeptidase A|nr:M3 family metallopeptidase [Bryobacteraceae bacterium]
MPSVDARNPLLEVEFQIPFDQIRAEHVEPAAAQLLRDAQAQLDRLTSDSGPRTFSNTMEPLDELTERLDYAVGIARHLEAVATTPELRAAYNTVQPLVSAFYSSLPLNESLWQAVQAYAKTEEAKSLSGARKRFLAKTIDNFRRHGAELDAPGKARIAGIDVELSKLTIRFSENVLDSTNEFELVIAEESKLAGLPESAIAMARDSARSKGLQAPAWRFTLQAPSYVALMTYLDDAEIRRHVYDAYVNRALAGNRDNRLVIQRILELRREKANLLGYRDFADLVLEDRMAHKGDRAQEFLADLKSKTDQHFEKENDELAAFAGRATLAPWDIAYYAEKQRAALYDFDEEALRPYFPLASVVQGMFEIVERLYGIRVLEKPGVPVWEPQVKYYQIHDESRPANNTLIGAFYADWFPRENKRGGAWMDAFITGVAFGNRLEPHAGLICGNLTPPGGDRPSLLTHREVQTIFHEFGHLLHHCLSQVEVRSLAGANVAWDFVELPSQIMENWCWEREALDLFAHHYQTGQPVPRDLFEKMVNARNFRAANAQMRQLGFGFVDLSLHREYSPQLHPDVLAYARAILQAFFPARLPEHYGMIASFTHLFASPVGYGAGYYSYKWAEVLDADAFTMFQTRGIFSRDVGARFRDNILSRGDSQDPAELYRTFMGRDPDPNALLERSGLLTAK